MTQSSLGDGDILQGTVKTASAVEGLINISFTLPSGRVVRMEKVNEDDLKGRELISWVNAVREQDSLDIQQATERERLQDNAQPEPGRPSAAPLGSDASVSSGRTRSSKSTLPDDPTSLILDKTQSLKDQLTIANQEMTALGERVALLHKNLEQWSALAQGLSIDPEPSSEEPTKPSPKTKKKGKKS